MTRAVWELPVRLPRSAFTPRDVARAGDAWRLCQEVAVEASTLAGWPPARYREEGTAFVVRAMTVRHHRELRYGEALTARTWVSRFARGILSERQIRIVVDGELAVSATQEWAHVGVELGAGADVRLVPRRGTPELLAAFPDHREAPATTLPDFAPADGPASRFELTCWHTWMDPLAHVNHPAYLDWCDESLARRVAAAGLSPVGLVPVAERLVFRAGAVAGDRVSVESRLAGSMPDGPLAIRHELRREDGGLLAEATTVRALAGGDPDALLVALSS